MRWTMPSYMCKLLKVWNSHTGHPENVFQVTKRAKVAATADQCRLPYDGWVKPHLRQQQVVLVHMDKPLQQMTPARDPKQLIFKLLG